MKTFSFPNTPTCRVVYVRQGVTYSGTIPTPKTQVDLLQAMSAREAKVNDILRIEAVEPRAEFSSSHPAMHRMEKFTAAAERQ